MIVRFNINGYVSVRLTASGKLIHRREYDELRKLSPRLPKYKAPKPDANGYTQWQLWHLMQTFGPAISHGAEPPFEMEIMFEVPSPPQHEGQG